MMCMTELHGGVCHRASTPHKSGNKMKEKKKKCITNEKEPTITFPMRHLQGLPRYRFNMPANNYS